MPIPEIVTNDAQHRMAPRSKLLLGILVLSAFVMALNDSIINIALKNISEDLDVPSTTVQWLVSAFLLTMAVISPTTGFLLARFTSRQVFLGSVIVFSIGTTINGIAPDFGVLLAGRVVQACGAAAMITLMRSLVMGLAPLHRRGSAMGTVSLTITVAPAIGPGIGGAIVRMAGWRGVFWFILVLTMVALVAGALWFRLGGRTRRVPLDLRSILLSAVGFGALLYGLSTFSQSVGGDRGLPPWITIPAGVTALTMFTWRQIWLQREERALLDLRPFTYSTFAVAMVLVGLIFVCVYGLAVTLPWYLQVVVHAGTFGSGLAILPGGLTYALLARPVGAMYDHFGSRWLVIPGALAVATSMLLFSTLGPNLPLAVVISLHVTLMSGFSFMITPLTAGSLAALPDHLHPHASAILSTLQPVAGAVGTATFISVAALAGTSPGANGLHAAFFVGGAVGVLILVGSLVPSASYRPSAASGGA